MRKVLNVVTALLLLPLLASCAGGVTGSVRDQGNKLGQESVELRKGGTVFVVPLPDNCGPGVRECAGSVSTPKTFYYGGFTFAVKKDMMPSEQCGGLPCPWTVLATRDDPGVAKIVLDKVDVLAGPVITSRAIVKASKNEEEGVRYSADQRVEEARNTEGPLFLTQVGTEVFSLNQDTTNVKVGCDLSKETCGKGDH